jgi:hypothetical protein
MHFPSSHCKQDLDTFFMSYEDLFFSFQMRAAWAGLLATDIGRHVLPNLEGQMGARKGLRVGDHGSTMVNPWLTVQGLQSGM